jgi:hypothetical protein
VEEDASNAGSDIVALDKFDEEYSMEEPHCSGRKYESRHSVQVVRNDHVHVAMYNVHHNAVSA